MAINIPTSFVVDRTRWFRGQGSDRSRLLLDDGQMCCVGFLAIACGATVDQISNEPAMASQFGEWRQSTPELYPLGLKIGQTDIYGINDDSTCADSDREILLKEQFNRLGIAVTFEG